MGIGHRVYRVLDPRAPLKRMAQKLTKELGEPKWIQMSERIAELMLEKKNLNANVDFTGHRLLLAGYPHRPVHPSSPSRVRLVGPPT